MLNRKPIFDAVRLIRGGQAFTLPEVRILDAGIDAALGVPEVLAPVATAQIGLSYPDFAAAADRLQCTVAQIRAVDEVESGGGWFTDVRQNILALDGEGGFLDGPNLPKILFEAHIFDRETNGKYRTSHPNISSKNWNRSLYVGGQGEYTRLYAAMKLDRTAALKSASVGRYQIMGYNHVLAGFSTVEAYWEAMKQSEAAQLSAFVHYVQAAKLDDELRKISNVHADCIPFAKGYNGAGYAQNNYHVKLAKAHKKWSGT